MDIKSRTPEDLLRYFYDNTSQDSFSFLIEKSFWYSFGGYDIERCVKLLQEIKIFIESNIYLENIDEVKELLNLLKEINDLINILNQLHDIANKPKGFFKSVKSHRALKRGDNLLIELKKKFLMLHELIGRIYTSHPKSINEKRRAILEKFPYLKIESVQDFETLSKLERNGVFESKIFRLLHKYVFYLFPEHSLPIQRLELLIATLSNPINYKTYFYNVQRFRRLFSEEAIKRIVENKYIKDEMLFLNTKLFDFCELWLTFLKNSFPWEEKLEARDAWYVLIQMSMDTLENGYKILKKLSSTNIIMERALVSGLTMHRLINAFTEGMIDILVLFGIRKIHNFEELNLLAGIVPLFKKHNDFSDKKMPLSKLWHSIIDSSARDLYHMCIFLRLYTLLGDQFFNELTRKKIILSSSDLHDLEVQADYEYVNKDLILEEFLDRNQRKYKERKLILITIPKDDWNLAFQSEYEEIKKIPRELYEIHFACVTAVNQLALLIKKIASKKKIDILIIGGHGSPTGIHLGSTITRDSDIGHKPRGYLGREELNTTLFRDIRDCFSPEAVCYLFSCSTGAYDTAIANDISRIFGIKVYAPPVNTSTSIEVKPNGELEFKYGGIKDIKAKMFIQKPK